MTRETYLRISLDLMMRLISSITRELTHTAHRRVISKRMLETLKGRALSATEIETEVLLSLRIRLSLR